VEKHRGVEGAFVMKSHRLCPLTHSLLAAGNCHFCERPVINGDVAPDRAADASGAVRWNVSAVLASLAADEDTREDTDSILFCHCGELFEELPIWRAVLDHPDSSMSGRSDSMLTRRYRGLQGSDAERCERHLRAHPDEFVLRVVLLGYYLLRSHQFPSERMARQQHCLWVIEHRPGSYIAGTPFCFPTPEEAEPYEATKKLWLRHADTLDVSAAVLGNAARFFTLNDEDQSERLYQKAQELEPENAAWPSALGHLYRLRNVRLNPNERGPNATRALEQFERAFLLSKIDRDRGHVLIEVSKAAFDAGEHARARIAAEEMFRISLTDANPADTLHAAHTILGRLALKEGNIEEAKRCLAAAAEAIVTKAGVFAPGPRELWLAHELLERGERTAVIEYLQRCSAVWQDPWHRADIWTSAIERGEVPDFRHHRE
jgi:tetratricopeptide (TPR) repeat protein